MNFRTQPTRNLFFTGKGGVGKTSVACATAIALADSGRRVLLVSTDPASNLDEMLGVGLCDHPTAIESVPGLSALNVDPDAAAEAYRQRVLEPLRATASEVEVATVREQLSGACTTEIAAFDEFAGLLAGVDDAQPFDHVIFDTAPTGHTLRLLTLAGAWTHFLESNTRGASCLGPHSALKTRQDRFAQAFEALCDADRTTVVLVTRPEPSALREAERTAVDLKGLGIHHQELVINGVFQASDASDAIAAAWEQRGALALAEMPPTLQAMNAVRVPLHTFNLVGIPALRALFQDADPAPMPGSTSETPSHPLPTLDSLIDALAANPTGLIMVMGKGGVGKTTVAAAIAVSLAARGIPVHLSTTDPAAHVADAVGENVAHLEVSRIDPKAETQAYIDKMMASKGRNLDAEGRALLAEDLQSPCTEEVAVFHAFSRVVAQARRGVVVLDTAPTGHTLLLLDATGAYHRQIMRDFKGDEAGRLVTPLMRLKDPAYTHILLVTLPETTPVSEAAALQEDLRRAGIEPYAWVINSSLAATPTRDPVLWQRSQLELVQIRRVESTLAQRIAVIPWTAEPPVGAERLLALTTTADAPSTQKS